MNYETIYDTSTTAKFISVFYEEFFSIRKIFLVWIDLTNKVYFFEEGDVSPTEITPPNFNEDYGSYTKNIQIGESKILLFNRTHIFLYEDYGTSFDQTFYGGNNILKAFLDEQREYVVYAVDVRDGNRDGKIYRLDYNTGISTLIKDGCDIPVDIYCTTNFIFWLESGWMDSGAKISRNSYYYDDEHPLGFYSKVSKIESSSVRLMAYEDSMDTKRKGKCVYFDRFDGLFIINNKDDESPYWEYDDWITPDYNTTDDDWTIRWNVPIDLNIIPGYEIRVYMTPDLFGFNQYFTEDTELTFSDMDYGSYYFKIIVNDSEHYLEMNEAESGILNINYYVSILDPPPFIFIPGFNAILFPAILLGIAFAAKKIKTKF